MGKGVHGKVGGRKGGNDVIISPLVLNEFLWAATQSARYPLSDNKGLQQDTKLLKDNTYQKRKIVL